MFHVEQLHRPHDPTVNLKALSRGAKAREFGAPRLQGRYDQLDWLFAHFIQKHPKMLAIELGGWIIQQEGGLSARFLGKQPDLGKQQDGGEQLLLAPGYPVANAHAVQPNGEVGTMRAHLGRAEVPVPLRLA